MVSPITCKHFIVLSNGNIKINGISKELIIFASNVRKTSRRKLHSQILLHRDKTLARVRRIADTIKRLVTDLEKHTSLSGRNISYDRLYTSISLAKLLLERNITTVGTLQANGKGIVNIVTIFGNI